MGVQSTIIAKYGNPSVAYQSKYCMIWEVQKDFAWFPVKKILINKEFKDKLFNAFTQLEKEGLHTEIKTFDGCYNDRAVRGKSSTSLHAWCMAVDMNSAIEKLAQIKTNWSKRFIEIMIASGIFWGGNWQSRKDNMHFALYNG
tara:strand:- start:6737 stop:7165 length:429 start_codon:yes stop_codon:yes gene_type:complete